METVVRGFVYYRRERAMEISRRQFFVASVATNRPVGGAVSSYAELTKQ
jgi:hypothetical protein